MSEGRKLAITVHYAGQVYPAGSTPPAEVAAKFTNPNVWQAGTVTAPTTPTPTPPVPADKVEQPGTIRTEPGDVAPGALRKGKRA